MNDLTIACCEFTGPFEGNVLWPYLDGGGNVTIGVGHLLYSDLYAQMLFAGIPVHDFAEQWDALKALSPGRPADFYETATDLRITAEKSLALFQSDMYCKIDACRRSIPTFDTLPQPAQIVCADLEFNVGVEKFPHFLAALGTRDWASMAMYSHRKEIPEPGGVQPERNTAVRRLLNGLATTPRYPVAVF